MDMERFDSLMEWVIPIGWLVAGPVLIYAGLPDQWLYGGTKVKSWLALTVGGFGVFCGIAALRTQLWLRKDRKKREREWQVARKDAAKKALEKMRKIDKDLAGIACEHCTSHLFTISASVVINTFDPTAPVIASIPMQEFIKARCFDCDSLVSQETIKEKIGTAARDSLEILREFGEDQVKSLHWAILEEKKTKGVSRRAGPG